MPSSEIGDPGENTVAFGENDIILTFAQFGVYGQFGRL
jgi:hypothetical protein